MLHSGNQKSIGETEALFAASVLELPLFGLAASSQRAVEKAGEAIVPKQELLKQNEALRRENTMLSQQLAENSAGNLTSKQVEFAKNIHSSGSDLLNLITDILDLSKIESGTVTVEAEEINFPSLRDSIERNFRHVADAKNLPFRVEFFHPGYLYQEPVHINEFTLTHVQSVRFVQDFFNYRSLRFEKQVPADTGYAGYRLLYELNEPGKWDELGAFLGASYFRLLGKGQRYGQSARGLALDCGESGRPEEFPIFTDWWLGKPSRGDDRVKIYAILDSVSCVGAYEMIIIPGEATVADIKKSLGQ
jgi:hypothetical protein